MKNWRRKIGFDVCFLKNGFIFLKCSVCSDFFPQNCTDFLYGLYRFFPKNVSTVWFCSENVRIFFKKVWPLAMFSLFLNLENVFIITMDNVFIITGQCFHYVWTKFSLVLLLGLLERPKERINTYITPKKRLKQDFLWSFLKTINYNQ